VFLLRLLRRPDFIKASTAAFSEWHYIDLPYAPAGDGGAAPTCGGGAQNIVWALEAAAAVLRSAKSDPWSRSTMLRFLIHFMGDVHQARLGAVACAKLFARRHDCGCRAPRARFPAALARCTAAYCVYHAAAALQPGCVRAGRRSGSLFFAWALTDATPQPLHAASLYTSAFPSGDEGGNAIKARAARRNHRHASARRHTR
jgi:hypothetical protein